MHGVLTVDNPDMIQQDQANQMPADPMQAQPAPQDQASLIDASDEEQLELMADAISDYIHGDAREHVATSMANAGEEALVDTLAAMSYQILTMVSDQVAKSAPETVTLDVLLPLATVTIDYLIEVAEAVGVPVPNMLDVQEDSLLRMIEIHMAKVGDDPEQKAIADEMFKEYLEDGSFDDAAGYVQQRLKDRGQDPSVMEEGGKELLAPKQNQLSAGVQQGLIDQSGGMS